MLRHIDGVLIFLGLDRFVVPGDLEGVFFGGRVVGFLAMDGHWFDGEGSGDFNPPSFTARQRVSRALTDVLEPKFSQKQIRSALALGPG